MGVLSISSQRAISFLIYFAKRSLLAFTANFEILEVFFFAMVKSPFVFIYFVLLL